MAAAVLDHNGHPVAGVAVTVPEADDEPGRLATEVRRTAETLTRRIGGGAPAR